MNSNEQRRTRARWTSGTIGVALVVIGALLPAAQLSGPAIGVTIVAAVIAGLLFLTYVTSEAGTLAAAILVALTSTVLGGTAGPTPRALSFLGGLMVFLGVELGRLSLDQRSPAPIDQDPPGAAFRPTMLVFGAGAAASAVVLIVSTVRLPSPGVLAVLGAVGLVVLAAVLAHPGPMLGGALDDDDE